MIIGDSVGKTSFLYRFCENKFKDQVPTIFETYSKEYEVNGQKKILRYSLTRSYSVIKTFKIQPSWLEADINILRISDTAGQEEYENVRRLAYPGTDVLIIAFNIMERGSFDNITKTWIKDKKNYMKKAKVGKNLSCMDEINPQIHK